ncbi:MAG: hypothetical protein WCC17_08985 [Candidatus Nitrosopolaris sp.]
MNSKKGFAFSIVAIAAVIALFSSGPLVESMQALAGHIYGVDINTGRQIWKFPMMNMVDSSAAIASNMMLIGSRDGLLYTFGSLHLI